MWTGEASGKAGSSHSFTHLLCCFFLLIIYKDLFLHISTPKLIGRNLLVFKTHKVLVESDKRSWFFCLSSYNFQLVVWCSDPMVGLTSTYSCAFTAKCWRTEIWMNEKTESVSRSTETKKTSFGLQRGRKTPLSFASCFLSALNHGCNERMLQMQEVSVNFKISYHTWQLATHCVTCRCCLSFLSWYSKLWIVTVKVAHFFKNTYNINFACC